MARVPKLRSGCDIKSLPLTPADGFLLSRVDAIADERELAVATGFTVERVAEMLERLVTLGAVELTRGDTPGSSSQTRLRAVPSRPSAREDEVEIDPACRRRIDDLHLRRQALARKLTGTFAKPAPPARVEPGRHHDGGGPHTPASGDPGYARLTAEAFQAYQERVQAEACALEAARSIEQARSALERGDLEGAIVAFRAASALVPSDREVRETCDDGIRRAQRALADAQWAQAQLEEREVRWEEAARCYAVVCAGRPGDPAAHERAANAFLHAGDVRRAVEMARKAVELEPRSALYHIALARTYGAAHLEASLHGELDRALELAPGDPRVEGMVARFRSLARQTGKAS